MLCAVVPTSVVTALMKGLNGAEQSWVGTGCARTNRRSPHTGACRNRLPPRGGRKRTSRYRRSRSVLRPSTSRRSAVARGRPERVSPPTTRVELLGPRRDHTRKATAKASSRDYPVDVSLFVFGCRAFYRYRARAPTLSFPKASEPRPAMSNALQCPAAAWVPRRKRPE